MRGLRATASAPSAIASPLEARWRVDRSMEKAMVVLAWYRPRARLGSRAWHRVLTMMRSPRLFVCDGCAARGLRGIALLSALWGCWIGDRWQGLDSGARG